NSIWEGRTPSHGTTHAEAAVSECGTCVAYFKRRWTNATNVKKVKSEAAHRELSRFSRLPTPGLPVSVLKWHKPVFARFKSYEPVHKRLSLRFLLRKTQNTGRPVAFD